MLTFAGLIIGALFGYLIYQNSKQQQINDVLVEKLNLLQEILDAATKVTIDNANKIISLGNLDKHKSKQICEIKKSLKNDQSGES